MRRLFIDLDICNSCQNCKTSCQNFYYPQDKGITNLREYATFATICRHCEEAPCVNACYHSALERAKDGHIKRYKMRCTSCRCCSIACPFGVIFEDFIGYLDAKCNFCLTDNNIDEQLLNYRLSCEHKAVEFKDVEEDPGKDIYFVGDYLAVHSRKWFREEQAGKNK